MADLIRLEDVECRCILGVHVWERRHPQLVTLVITVALDGGVAARSGVLADTADYSLLAAVARFVLAAGRFHLVETAVEAVCAAIRGVVAAAPVVEVAVELTKPEALPGASRIRYAASRPVAGRGLQAETLFDGAGRRLARVDLAPGAALPPAAFARAGSCSAVAVLALAGGIDSLPPGLARHYDVDAARALRNSGSSICPVLLLALEGGEPADDPLTRDLAGDGIDFFRRAGHYYMMVGKS